MRIISHLNAVTKIASQWDELRPLQGAPFITVIEALRTKYKFQAVGQSPISQAAGLMTPLLQTGVFESDEGPIQINQLDFQPTGVFIGSGTTEQAKKIEEDLFAFLHTTLGFRTPHPSRKRTYATTIIVDAGEILGSIFKKWEKIISFINSCAKDEAPILPFGVKFIGYQNGEVVGDRQFLFERRLPSPPGENWIFSQGVFDTETHIKILKKIESEFKA
jgi:hypothetical protein